MAALRAYSAANVVPPHVATASLFEFTMNLNVRMMVRAKATQGRFFPKWFKLSGDFVLDEDGEPKSKSVRGFWDDQHGHDWERDKLVGFFVEPPHE